MVKPPECGGFLVGLIIRSRQSSVKVMAIKKPLLNVTA